MRCAPLVVLQLFTSILKARDLLRGQADNCHEALEFLRVHFRRVISQPGMESENASLGHAGLRFKVCSNHPDNNENWNSSDPAWVGKAAMSKRHRFLSTKDLHGNGSMCSLLVSIAMRIRSLRRSRCSRT